MSTFFEINPQSKIGYKKLSVADLGTGTSHQTHIGLYEDTLEFVSDVHKTSSSKFIYQNTAKELVCLIDFIENPDGSFRSPKIRKGSNNELEVNGVETNSVVREIREIVANTNPNDNWFLMWFGLNNEELVFYLLRDNSVDFNQIQNIIPSFQNGGRIENTNPNFAIVLRFLETKIENSSIQFLQDLEIIAQTDEVPTKIIKPRFFDIEKAKKAYKETGRKGEELVAEYLNKLKSEEKIVDFNWVNQSRESSFPYDFEITDLTQTAIYTDVKTTSYTFNQEMIFSKSELLYINQSTNYHVYRVFDLKEEIPSLRICKDISQLSKNLVDNITTFQSQILQNQTNLNSLKLAIAPSNNLLNFDAIIDLL
jgi:hypothetical protein